VAEDPQLPGLSNKFYNQHIPIVITSLKLRQTKILTGAQFQLMKTLFTLEDRFKLLYVGSEHNFAS